MKTFFILWYNKIGDDMDYIHKKLSLLPMLPGCYLMKNSDGNIIYVGKAKKLKNRVSSYFRGTHNYKTTKLVSEIVDFDYIVVNSERESLILENNLIKKHNPKYNILLKDDKSYPYIEVVDSNIPQVKIIRTLNKNKTHKYLFGPYPNVNAARSVLKLINRMYKTRKCETFEKKPCLYYHIGECLGYCQNNYNVDEALKMKEEIIKFLKGDYKNILNKIKSEMEHYSENLEFEKALEMKNLMDYINITLSNQKVEINELYDIDCFGYYFDDLYITIEVFFIRNAKIVESYYKTIPLIDDPIDTFEEFVANFYHNKLLPKEILIPDIGDTSLLKEFLNVNVRIPKKGKLHDLVNLASSNAKTNQLEKLELIKRDEERTIDANEDLKNLLGLKKLDRIELFDNSNLFGTFAVSGMVVFKNGKKAKSEYRKYKVLIDKNDDYGTMKEVIYRRYFRVLMDNLERPDLIIVDGGLGQIHVAKEVIESLNLNIMVVGLKKNDNHKTEALIDDDKIYPVEKHSNLFNYLETMQDEVHNFTISYHKNLRSKGALTSILDNIKGIGIKRKKQLLKKYKTLSNISLASIDELSEIMPKDVAIILKETLKNMNNN